MGDTFALMHSLEQTSPDSAVIVGAGYIGLEMADALTTRGLAVTQMEQLPEVLPMRFTGDRSTGRLLGVQLFGHRHAEIAKRIDVAATAIFHAMTVSHGAKPRQPSCPGSLKLVAASTQL